MAEIINQQTGSIYLANEQYIKYIRWPDFRVHFIPSDH